MEAPGCRRRQLPVLLLWVNGLMMLGFGLMMLGFAGARQQTNLCNESLMLEKLPACGKSFEEMMKKVDSKKWCNLTDFITPILLLQQSHNLLPWELPADHSVFASQGIALDQEAKGEIAICVLEETSSKSYYDNFTQCTEREANNASCFWPNPLTEGFITGIHKQFFSNCTSEKVHWEDPPDEILITLILIPVMLTCAMITLVVWCSKRSDILV
ncbi:receptor activity-modifying protein 3 isoform X1 [Numenius arquata]|uniref:receptor activity-modifying protein 3 isoform X1 n=1 Tax=Numenius arquata TaxID=31919 RepID=UPI003D30BC55